MLSLINSYRAAISSRYLGFTEVWRVGKFQRYLEFVSSCNFAFLLLQLQHNFNKLKEEKMELDLDTMLDIGCCAGAYLCLSKKLLEEVQAAIDEAKTELGKHFDVSAIMKQLPPPQLPPFQCPFPEEDNYDEAEVAKFRADKKLMMIVELDRYLENAYLLHRQQGADLQQMTKLTDYLVSKYGSGYADGHVDSVIQRYVARVDESTESYWMELDARIAEAAAADAGGSGGAGGDPAVQTAAPSE
ncbi:hypothetical protein MIMGU_mgv1a012699mg [Erythranthe guttata]|uniref:Uncharacterized protein n=1 Tax=Erythranthe guttata TaxID=4155 RepID=A0A022QM57_ERYGU|nr:hypothetical protein MIMGU_mgv1a012699mg [Erythranthe guttata]